MKIRSGFVSNSSSSSFIVPINKLKHFEECNIKTYKVSDIFDAMRKISIVDAFEFTYEDWDKQKGIPDFIRQSYEALEYVSILKELSPDTYISDAVNRDWAYFSGLDHGNLEVFQGDL